MTLNIVFLYIEVIFVVDNNYMFLYYIVNGIICKEQNQMNGGFYNVKKNRGIRFITKYWKKY
jgi:hypothetical protein